LSVNRSRGCIRVKDIKGGRFSIVTRERIETELGPPRKVVWFELETGEPVGLIDANTFVLTRTGKKLQRVRRVKERTRHKS
jgi:hypothetical protein